MTSSWTEGTAYWSYHDMDGATWREHVYTDGDQSGTGDWTAAGGDYDQGTVHAQIPTSELLAGQWFSLDIKDLVQSWATGQSENHGLMLRTTASGASIYYRSSEYAADASLRPKLTITYTQ
jgi:hypothetical protein